MGWSLARGGDPGAKLGSGFANVVDSAATESNGAAAAAANAAEVVASEVEEAKAVLRAETRSQNTRLFRNTAHGPKKHLCGLAHDCGIVAPRGVASGPSKGSHGLYPTRISLSRTYRRAC